MSWFEQTVEAIVSILAQKAPEHTPPKTLAVNTVEWVADLTAAIFICMGHG